MKFKYTILYVENVAAALTFYNQAFGFKTKMLHEAGDYGELDTGDTVLAFSSIQLMNDLGKNAIKASPDAPMFEIAIETVDVNSALAQAVSAGAKLVQDAQEQPWGQTTSYVSDPNGFMVEICSPVG